MNGLPVYSKMFEKGIQSGVDCPVCGEELENILHALISCDCALSVWLLWQDYPLRLLLNASDFLDVVHKICSPPVSCARSIFLQFLGRSGITETRLLIMTLTFLLCKSGNW